MSSIKLGIFGAINSVLASSVRDALRPNVEGDVDVDIDSTGGEVNPSLAIHDMLKAHSGRVNVNIVGVAASGASLVAMAGDHVAASSNSFLMIHFPNISLQWGQAAELRRTADYLEKITDRMVNIYSARTGRAKDVILAEMEHESWFTADEALALGFIDAITPARKVAAGGWNLAEFKNVPSVLLSGAKESTTMEKRFDECTLGELHRIGNDDPQRLALMVAQNLERKAALKAEPWKFKTTYAALSYMERAALALNDRALFNKMRAEAANPTLGTE